MDLVHMELVKNILNFNAFKIDIVVKNTSWSMNYQYR